MATLTPFHGDKVIYKMDKQNQQNRQDQPGNLSRSQETPEHFPFKEGQKVIKSGGDYTFEGVIVCVFSKRSGATRYVVENDAGIVHIFSALNLVAAGSKSTADKPTYQLPKVAPI